MNRKRCGITGGTPKPSCQTEGELQAVQPFPTSGPLADNLGLPLPLLKSNIGKTDSRAYSYVLSTVGIDHDATTFEQHGSAPNFQGGVLSLCTCKVCAHQSHGARFARIARDEATISLL